MLKIAVITGSTRPGRRSPLVAEWVKDRVTGAVSNDANVVFDLIDIADYDLPLLDEPFPAIVGKYQHTCTKSWASTIQQFDGFIFVTPEYNHSFFGRV